jgi:hypothetical protein
LIRGQVDLDGVPRIHLKIGAGTWPAMIDTGFNGDLELPAQLAGTLKGFAKPVMKLRTTPTWSFQRSLQAR